MDVVIEHVWKRFGAHEALHDVDLRIAQGMFGLLGPNGAGKTTLLRILATMLRPTSGTVMIGAYDLSQRAQRQAVRAQLGYLPQELGFYPDLTGREFLDYIGLLKRLYDGGARRRQIAALLDVVSLTAQADDQIKTYSGGMKRRLGIAQALLGDARILVIDEPTAGLDPEERIRLRILLTQLAENRVVILSTHVVEDISQTCERLAVLDHGMLAFDGQTRQLIASAEGHTWQFLAAPGHPIPEQWTLISALPQRDETLYRVVGPEPHSMAPTAQPVAPALEDGYVWLRQSSAAQRATRSPRA